MTGFDITLIISIIWLFISFILIKNEGKPCDFEEWSMFIFISLFGTLICCFFLILLYFLGCALYNVNWSSYFHDKIIMI